MKTTVIITHHLNENQPYLDLCINSVLASEGADFDVLVMADTPKAPQISTSITPGKVQLIWATNLDTGTKKANAGMQTAFELGADHVLLLGDDVMISKHLINAQSTIASQLPMILNPYSNNDKGSVYMGGPQLRANGRTTIDLYPTMHRQTIAGYEQAIIDYPAYDPIIIPRHFVPFFCTLIPKKIWEAVGNLDERLDLRHNDEDYCIRARKQHFMTAINFGVFALHFGGKTLDKTVTMEDRDKCTEAFKEKWGLQRA